MKKIIFLAGFFILIGICANAAALEACDIKFTPEGNGRYIYENNNEAIRRMDLSDTSNPKPAYLMNNNNLKKDKYAVFISNLNHTESEDGTELGFDIEVDMQIVAKSDLNFKVTSAGFEIVDKREYYDNGNLVKYEDSWSCLTAWSTYLKIPIYQKDGKKYEPQKFNPVEITLKKGEVYWLSSVLPDYREVPYLKAVHILADFEILSGSADVNVAALKHNGALKDRSHHSPNATFGIYYRDKQYKGIAETLPRMNTSLSFEINDTVKSGALLPVKVYNQYNPQGKILEKWMTNINPQADIWSKNICTESDMISIKYYDESKLKYYGKFVPKDKQSPYWMFDTYHSDTELYDGSAKSADYYSPNYELDVKKDNLDAACNLGNYGVSLYYTITINNKGANNRYVNYKLNTSSGNIIILRDETGKIANNYALCKGNRNDKKEEVLASVSLPAKKKTTFILQVLLPTNAAGGMENSLEIADIGEKIEIPDIYREKIEQRYIYTGKNYLKWESGKLFATNDLETWTQKTVSNIAKELFDGNWNEFDIIETEGGYMVKSSAYDGSPGAYREIWKQRNWVYFFNEQFYLMSRKRFEQFPTDMGYANGIYYVKAGECYSSSDMVTWNKTGFSAVPVSNGGKFCAVVKDNALYISADGKKFYKTTYSPAFIGAVNGAFYYSSRNNFYVSADAVYWKEYDIGENANTVVKAGSYLLVNDRTKIEIPSKPEEIWVKLNDEVLAFDTPPILNNSRTLVPMRLLFEKMGCKVEWNEETKTAMVTSADKIIEFILGSDTAYINGEPFALDTPAVQQDSRTLVPLRFLSEQLGYNVSWNENLKLADIKK